jgi:two-component system, sensor histidine kinase and response regulator
VNQNTDQARSVDIGVVLIDRDSIVLSVTDAAEEIFGQSKEQLVGSDFQLLLSDAAAADLENILLDHLSGTNSDALDRIREVQCRHQTGDLFTADLSISEIEQAGQTIFLCGIRNIERQANERGHSRRLVEEMKAVLNNASYGTLMLDARLGVRHANATFLTMWGIDENKLLGLKTVEDLRGLPDGADIFPAGGLEALQSETGEAFEIRREDGRVLERRNVFLPNENLLLTYYDITDLAQQADTARSNSDRHTYAMQAADQAFWDWNLLTDKMTMGERFWLQIQRMYLGPEIEARAFFDLVHKDDREFLEYTLRAYADGEVEDSVGAVDTFRITTPTGEERFFALGFSVVESNATPYLTGLIRDITEPRRLRRAITEARDEAREANRAKSDFLATMSHEIRTPMNGILGMAGLLLDTQLDATQRDYAQIVKESGESLLTIINDILDFSKFEAGRLELEVIEFDLQSVVEGACRLLAPRAHTKNLELEADIPPGLPNVLKGDPGRLRQVVLNLIGNAIKFTDSGAISLRVSVLDQTSEIAHVRVEIIDSGIGVPEDKFHTLFEKFSQADSSVNRRYGGTGLGLAICKSLISLMNGEIGVSNNKGPGSTFWFEIPLEIAEDSPVTAARASDIAGLRICVISQEDRDRNQFHTLFGSWNMAVEVTASVADAVNMIRQGTQTGTPFDFALLEVNSDDIDPVAFAKTIQEDPESSGTHLILATSSGVRGEAAEMKDAGFSAYITKPVERPILYQILSELAASKDSRETPWLTKHLAAEHGRRQLSVLVAEDNLVNQKLIVALLEKLGHSSILAADGIEALALLQENSFDVVLMDVYMPNKNGIETTEDIRRLSGELATIPIIALTASTAREDIASCLKAGMNGFVSKPVDPLQLAECLQDVTSPAGARAVAEPTTIAPGEIDPTTIDQLSAVLGPHKLLDLIATFVSDHEPRLERIEQISAEGDVEALKREAHDLKGTCGNMGFVGLSTMGQEVFDACKNDDINLARHKLKRLPEMNARVVEWLEARQKTMSEEVDT